MPNRRPVAWLARGLAAGWIVATGAAAGLAQAPTPVPAAAAKPDLVRIVRLKLSAADLASAEAWTEDYRRDHGIDATWLDARAWLARGAWMLGEHDRALSLAREVRAAIPSPTDDLLIPLGATYEVEGRILASRAGTAAGTRFFREAEKVSGNVPFRSRMWKNVNRLELVGQPAPEILSSDVIGGDAMSLAALRGRPVLLYFWAAGCGDCRASAPTLARLAERFGPRGLAIVAPTRLYGPGRDGTPATAAEERAEIESVLSTTYAGVRGMAVPVDTAAMVRYGASATPTFALVDREGIVRLYEPTRLTFDALAAAIEPLLAPAPNA